MGSTLGRPTQGMAYCLPCNVVSNDDGPRKRKSLCGIIALIPPHQRYIINGNVFHTPCHVVVARVSLPCTTTAVHLHSDRQSLVLLLPSYSNSPHLCLSTSCAGIAGPTDLGTLRCHRLCTYKPSVMSVDHLAPPSSGTNQRTATAPTFQHYNTKWIASFT